MLRSIAVTTDFSEASREAFDLAAGLKKRLDAKLFVVHVARTPEMFTPWQPVETPEDGATRRQNALRRLEDFVGSQACFTGVDVTPRVLSGESAGDVAGFLDEESIDVAVIATHGEAGMDHFPLGSFAADLLEASARSTLVVCSGTRRTRDEVEGRMPFAPTRILVPYDFSRRSDAALTVAADWIRTFGSRSRFLYVVSTVGPGSELSGAELERLASESRKELERTVEERFRDLDAEVVTGAGHPAGEILKEAEDFSAELIIMASRGLSLRESLDLGSVAEKTIHRARSPVLIVKPRRRSRKT